MVKRSPTAAPLVLLLLIIDYKEREDKRCSPRAAASSLLLVTAISEYIVLLRDRGRCYCYCSQRCKQNFHHWLPDALFPLHIFHFEMDAVKLKKGLC